MAKSNSRGKDNAEYVSGALNDDSDEELNSIGEDQPLDYESSILKEITDLSDEIEKVRVKMKDTKDKVMFENFAEYVLQIIIKLDNIEAKDYGTIREARKDAILYAQGTLEKLDSLLCEVKTD